MPSLSADPTWFLVLQARAIIWTLDAHGTPASLAPAVANWQTEFDAWWHRGADPEPVFALRAQDRLAPATISHYARQCRSYNLGDQSDETLLALQDFVGWQKRNPERLKYPDHKHVPTRRQT